MLDSSCCRLWDASPSQCSAILHRWLLVAQEQWPNFSATVRPRIFWPIIRFATCILRDHVESPQLAQRFDQTRAGGPGLQRLYSCCWEGPFELRRSPCTEVPDCRYTSGCWVPVRGFFTDIHTGDCQRAQQGNAPQNAVAVRHQTLVPQYHWPMKSIRYGT